MTKDFLGLGGEVTQCQTKEYRADCQSRRHRQQVLATCGCAPFSMMSYYGQQVRLECSLLSSNTRSSVRATLSISLDPDQSLLPHRAGLCGRPGAGHVRLPGEVRGQHTGRGQALHCQESGGVRTIFITIWKLQKSGFWPTRVSQCNER